MRHSLPTRRLLGALSLAAALAPALGGCSSDASMGGSNGQTQPPAATVNVGAAEGKRAEAAALSAVPGALTLKVGERGFVRIMASTEGGASVDVTSRVSVTLSDPAKATAAVGAADDGSSAVVVTGVAAGETALSASLDGASVAVAVTVVADPSADTGVASTTTQPAQPQPGPQPESPAPETPVNPPVGLEIVAPTEITACADRDVVVKLIFADGSRQDVTSSSTITSSAVDVLSVASAKLHGRLPGAATLTAVHDKMTATANVAVKEPAAAYAIAITKFYEDPKALPDTPGVAKVEATWSGMPGSQTLKTLTTTVLSVDFTEFASVVEPARAFNEKTCLWEQAVRFSFKYPYLGQPVRYLGQTLRFGHLRTGGGTTNVDVALRVNVLPPDVTTPPPDDDPSWKEVKGTGSALTP